MSQAMMPKTSGLLHLQLPFTWSIDCQLQIWSFNRHTRICFRKLPTTIVFASLVVSVSLGWEPTHTRWKINRNPVSIWVIQQTRVCTYVSTCQQESYTLRGMSYSRNLSFLLHHLWLMVLLAPLSTMQTQSHRAYQHPITRVPLQKSTSGQQPASPCLDPHPQLPI